MSGDGGSSSSNTTSNPWAGVQDPMLDVIGQAGTLYAQPYQQYQGPVIAAPSDSTVAARNLIYQRSSLGAPDLNAARGAATDYSSGAFMGSNPYVQQNSDWTKKVMADNAANQASGFSTGTAAQNDAMFARSGAYGGSAWGQKQTADATALAKSIGEAGNAYNMTRSGLGAQSYQQDAGNRLQAMGLAGSLSQDDWTAGKAMSDMGKDQTAYEQSLLTEAKNQYLAQMNAPYQNMTNYGNLLSQFGGFGSQQNQQMYGGGSSPLGTGISAGLLGLAGYQALKTP